MISYFSSASFTKKLPPIAAILSNAKNSSILLLSTPPVGINLTCGNGAESAFNAFSPPYTFAGKNLTVVIPSSNACIISVGVTQPG